MEYCCNKCDYTSKYRHHLSRHMCKEPKNLEHKCYYTGCTYSSDYKYHLDRHILSCKKNVIIDNSVININNSIVINNIRDKVSDEEIDVSDEEIDVSDEEIDVSDEEIDVSGHVNSSNFIKKFQEYDIVIKGTKEDPLFRASDIALILGIKNINSKIKKFSTSELCMLSQNPSRIVDINQYTLKGYKDISFLTELGLYRLVFSSNNSIVETFKQWVIAVIKDIRLTGRYEVKDNIKLMKDNTELARYNEKLCLEVMRIKEQTLINNNNSGEHVNYTCSVEKNIIKFGESHRLPERMDEHKKDIGPQCMLIDAKRSVYNKEIENMIKEDPLLKKHRISMYYPGRPEEKQTELLQLDDELTLEIYYAKLEEFRKTFKAEEMVIRFKDKIESLKDTNKSLKDKIRILEMKMANIGF